MGLRVCPTCLKSIVTMHGDKDIFCPREPASAPVLISGTASQTKKKKFGDDGYNTDWTRERG